MSALAILVLANLAVSLGCNRSQNKPEPPQVAVEPAVALPMLLPETRIAESRRLAAGTVIRVKMLEVLDSNMPITSPFIRAAIAEDVQGADSQLAIPAGSAALVVPLVASKVQDVSQIALSLYSVEVDGHQYHITGDEANPAVANVTIDSVRTPMNSTAHISAGDILQFALRKPAELR